MVCRDQGASAFVSMTKICLELGTSNENLLFVSTLAVLGNKLVYYISRQLSNPQILDSDKLESETEFLDYPFGFCIHHKDGFGNLELHPQH